MNLKNMLRKVVASIIVIYMTLGNCIATGIGIGQVIAEELNLPQPVIGYEISKYVQYDNQGGKGVILKANLAIREEITQQEDYQVIQEMILEIQVPKINDQNPERVNIVKNSTLFTNGKTDGEINQNYDSNSGLLTLSYNNENDELAYQENAKDEFEIIYIYPETAYTGNDEKVTITSQVTVKTSFAKTNQTIEKTEVLHTELKDNNSAIAAIETVETSEIYKGYLYANEESGTNYETDYTQKEEVEIINSQLLDKIVINEEDSQYINQDEEKIDANIEFKSTMITRSSFDQILGTDGYVDILVGKEKFATIKYGEADENGNRKYIVEYANGEQKEAEGRVEYTDGIDQIQMVTSKPITEGTLEITQEKTITAKQSKKVSSIKEIEETKTVIGSKQITVQENSLDENGQEVTTEKQIESNVTEAKEEKTIELKEPKTQVDITVDNQNLSVLTENKMNVTVTLRTDSVQYKLFKNPVIQIELPDGIEKISADDIQLLYGENSLKIKKATIQNNKTITIEMEGTQEKYNIGAVQEGASIIIPLTITFNKVTPSQDTKVKLTANNNGEKVTSEQEVKLISKDGLMSITNLYGYNGNQSLTLIDNQKEEAILEVGQEMQTATMRSTLVNNFGKDVTNVIILGKISETEEIASKLKNKINVSKDATIYYSENADAQATDNTWVTNINDLSKVKAYMIVIDSMKAGENITFDYQFTIPAELEYNQQTTVKYNVYCDLETESTESTSKGEVSESLPEEQNAVEITLKTIDIPNVSVKVQPNISLNYVHEAQIVEYIIKVKNEGDQTANSIIVEDIIPENATYTEYTTDSFDASHSQGGFQPIENVKNKTISISELAAGETQEVSIFLKVNSIDQDTATLENKVNVNAILETTNETKIISTATSQTEIRKASLDIEIKYMKMSNQIEEGEEILYYTYITNTSSEEIENITVTDVLDADISFNSDRSMGETAKNINVDENNVLTFEIEKIGAGETVFVSIPGILVNHTNYNSKILRNRITVSAKSIEDHESNTIYYEAKGSKVSIDMQSSTKTNIMVGEEITYHITLTNEGIASKNIKLRDELPENFLIDTVEVTDEEGTTKQESIGNIFTYVKELQANKTVEITLTGRMLSIDNNAEFELNNIAYVDILDANDNVIKTIQTESITNIIESNTQDDDSGETNQDPDGEESLPPSEDNPSSGDNGGESENRTYSIRGLAWLDANKNGQKDAEETLLSNITVMVINADTNELVKNENGGNYTVSTAEDGTYVVTGLAKGNYILLFEYDTNTYTVTVYQKNGVDDTVNSDVINKNIVIDGQTRLVALTDTITIDETGVSNVNIGLIENAIFDLSVNKYIDKVDVVNSQGTETHTWENQDTVKVDLVAKYINTANVVIDYKFVITNNGDVTGYVDKLVDDLPSGLEFSSELNKDWYRESDGQIATTSLSGIKIEPGQTSEVHLILTKSMTENSTGTIPNTANLASISNLEQIAEKDEDTANNEASAVLVLSIKTGSPILYISITLGCMIIIAAGAYIIKKKVLKGNI